MSQEDFTAGSRQVAGPGMQARNQPPGMGLSGLHTRIYALKYPRYTDNEVLTNDLKQTQALVATGVLGNYYRV